MRSSPDQVHALRHAAQRVLCEREQIRLFGCMAPDDHKIDVPLKGVITPPVPFFEIAKRTRVLP